MNRHALFLGALVCTSCLSARPGEDCLIGGRTLYGSRGNPIAWGPHTTIENRDFVAAERAGKPLPRWREFLRTGEWWYAYDDRHERARISYQVRFYTECCFGGPCKQPYETPVGEFEAWWPNRQHLAKGRFKLVPVHIDTNCEGGDTISRGVLSADTLYWHEDGSAADSSVLMAAGLSVADL